MTELLNDNEVATKPTIDKIIPPNSPLADKVRSTVIYLISLRPVINTQLEGLNDSDLQDRLTTIECQQIINSVKSDKKTEEWAVSYMLALYTEKYREYSISHESWQFISVYLQIIYRIAERDDKNFKRVNQLSVRIRMAIGLNSIQLPILKSLFDIHACHKTPNNLLKAIREYEAEVRHNEEFGESKSLNLAQKISQIRLAYEVVIENRKAITRKQRASGNNNSAKTPSRLNLPLPNADIPSRKIRFAKKYDRYNYNNVSEVENVADDDPIALLDNNYEPKKIVAKSSQLQQYQLKTNYLHSRRNQFYLATNTRVLDLYSYQLIFQNLWEKLISDRGVRKRQVICVILISLLTGRPLTTISHEVAINKSERQIIISDGMGTISIDNHIEVTPNRINKIKKYKRSHSSILKLPLPSELTSILLNKFTVSATSINEALKSCKHDLAMPALSRQHIESAMAFIITQVLGERLHADILTGVSVKHSAPLYYTSIKTESLLNTYQQALKKQILINKP